MSSGGFVWLGMFEPSGEEFDEVRESFGLHELAIEDAKTFHLRPKVSKSTKPGCNDILIAGAGVGGLTAALTLHGREFHSTVIDRLASRATGPGTDSDGFK